MLALFRCCHSRSSSGQYRRSIPMRYVLLARTQHQRSVAGTSSRSCDLQKHEPFNVIALIKTPYGLMICASWSKKALLCWHCRRTVAWHSSHSARSAC